MRVCFLFFCGSVGSAVRKAADLANLYRIQSGVDAFGQGRKSWFNNCATIIVLTDGGQMVSSTGPTNKLDLSYVNALALSIFVCCCLVLAFVDVSGVCSALPYLPAPMVTQEPFRWCACRNSESVWLSLPRTHSNLFVFLFLFSLFVRRDQRLFSVCVAMPRLVGAPLEPRPLDTPAAQELQRVAECKHRPLIRS